MFAGAIFLVLALIGIVIATGVGLYSGLSENEPGSKRGLATWIGFPVVANWSVAANFGDSYGESAAIGAVILLLCYCSFRPSPCSFKWALLAGLSVPALFVAIVSFGISGARLAYGILSGELKTEGWAGLPVDWMVSWATLGAISIGVLTYVQFIRRLAQRSSYEHRQKAYQKKRQQQTYYRTDAEDKNHNYSAQGRTYSQADQQRGGASSSPDDITASEAEQPWWGILEVEPTVTRQEAERSGKDLLKKYHPDRMWNTPRFRAEAERQTKLINAAIQKMREALPLNVKDTPSKPA